MYSPGNAPQLGFDIQQLWTELENIRNIFQTGQMDFIEFTIHNNEPDKPKEGRAYYADGTNWNPGSGRGLYLYVDGWVPMATSVDTHRPGKAILTLTGFAPSIHFDEILKLIPSGSIKLTGFAPSYSIP